jgi:predicted lipoprotein with Yx(FWY)xxD motif
LGGVVVEVRQEMTTTKTRSAAYGVAVVTVGLLAAACGSSSSGGAPSSAAVSPASGGGGTSVLRTESTSLGMVTADPQDRTIYELVGNPASNSKCPASCEAIWPPVMSNGKILMLHGHPLFTFTGDSAPGQTNGQGLRDTWGLWLALSSDGSPIAAAATTPTTTPAAPPTTAATTPASSGGGYGY